MKIKKLIPLFFLTIMSCSDEETQFFVDSRVMSQVDSFFYEAELRGLSLSKLNLLVVVQTPQTGRFKSDDAGMIGMSTKHGDQRIVFLSEDFIENEDHYRVEILVFHELGHALLYKQHVSTPNSIMYYHNYFGIQDFYKRNRECVLDEFFNDIHCD